MASHNELGKEAEQMAVNYLTQKGYKILHCNWRHSRYEIDIIAMKNELLRIIEVKSLKSSELRYPEESVTKTKFRNLSYAAQQFLHIYPQYHRIQFDILSINILPDKSNEFYLIEDVFF